MKYLRDICMGVYSGGAEHRKPIQSKDVSQIIILSYLWDEKIGEIVWKVNAC